MEKRAWIFETHFEGKSRQDSVNDDMGDRKREVSNRILKFRS